MDKTRKNKKWSERQRREGLMKMTRKEKRTQNERVKNQGNKQDKNNEIR
jgi:hypothetical protein